VDRDFRKAELFRREPSSVTNDDHAVTVNDDRLPEPERQDGLGNRLDGAGVDPRVLLVGNHAADRPHFDMHRSAPWHVLLCW
jgi:hypothetical protein